MADPNTGTGASSNGINGAFSSNKFFTASEATFTIAGINLGTTYSVMKPRNGVIDVVNSMQWSNDGSKKEVPQIMLYEKKLNYGTWATNLAELLRAGTNLLNKQSVDSFINLYSASDTGFYYNLPWLAGNGETLRSVDNSWSDAQGLGDFVQSLAGSGKSSSLGAIIGAGIGAGIGMITPGFGFEQTKQFSNTSPARITISFPLYNTISMEKAFDHFSFVNLFAFQNMKTRTSLMTYIPPCIYIVDAFSVGGLYMAAAYVQSFKVDSIGTVRRMNDYSGFGPKEILIPEAYKVTIVLEDLLSQSSNVFAGALGGTKIQVTNAQSPLQSLQNFATAARLTPKNK